MVRISNPYIAGPPIDGDEGFYGRQEVFYFVQSTFSSAYQKVIVLFGQRRIGKTSILYQLQKPSNLPEGLYPIYFNLEGRASQNLNEVLHALAEKIAEALNLPPVAQSEFQHGGDYFSERFLPQAYEALQDDQRLLLLFDEFDVLGEELSDETMALNTFFPYLQNRLFDEKKLVYIFVVGRRLEELTPEFLATFKQARTRPISFLSREEARRLIREPMLGILEYDDDAVEQILSVTACHPYLMQLVCFELVDYLDSLGKTKVTVDDVRAVIADAIESGGAGLAWLWDGLPIAERFILSAVTSVTDENGIATKESINKALHRHRIRLLGIELTRAPDMLVDWGWLEKTEERDGYKFVVELLRRWISKKHSLENAKRELESISKRAIRDYTYARQAHIDGDLEIAVESYRRALAANPNHAGAQIGLAQALHEQGMVEEAVTEYEKAYNLDEIASEGLIKVLLASGVMLEKDAPSVAEAVIRRYRRVLEIAPDNEMARRRLTDIKLAEAKAYEQQREWKRANDIYTWLIREFNNGEAKRRLQRMLEQWSLANLYTEAMMAHSARMWDLAQERWERLYSRNPDYVDEDGQRVSLLLKEAIVQRGRIVRRKRNLRLALVVAASALVLIPLGAWGITKYIENRKAQLVAAPTTTVTPTPSPSPSPGPTQTPTQESIVVAPSPTLTQVPTPIPTKTTTPKPTATTTNTPTFTPSPTWVPTATPVAPPPKPLGTVEVWDVDVNPRNSEVIYAVVKGQGIYRSTDGGHRWEATERTFETVESLTIDPTDPSILYAPIWGGILKSTDGGTTWELIAAGKEALPEPAHVLAVVPGDNQIIYAGTEGGVYRSSDGGQKWEARNKGMADTPIHSLVIGSYDGELVYAAGKGAEIWKSIDGGNSPWEKLACDYFKEAIYALALHPENSQWIYAGTNESTMVLSTNGGHDWHLRNWGLEHRLLSLKISSLAIDPKDPRIIYASTGFRSNLNGHGVYKSTDGGLGWKAINNGLPIDTTWLGGYYVQSIAIDPHDSQTIYAAGFGGLYKSTDGGQLWKRQ